MTLGFVGLWFLGLGRAGADGACRADKSAQPQNKTALGTVTRGGLGHPGWRSGRPGWSVVPWVVGTDTRGARTQAMSPLKRLKMALV
ncbi:MAG: hypothetical protein GX561_01930 [Lentisphaerae bacterium]|nr:hypothetical protein [Lentisphaerota bacterium]